MNSLSLPPYLPAYRPIHRIYIEYRYKDINIEHRYTFLYSGWDANRISIRVGKQTAGQRCCLSLPRLSSSTKLRRSAKRFVAFIATRKTCPSRAKLSKLLNSCEKTQFIYLVNNLSYFIDGGKRTVGPRRRNLSPKRSLFEACVQ